MHLVETQLAPGPSGPNAVFSGVPLVVTFADGNDLLALSAAGRGSLPVHPESSMGGDDCYLVLPDEIGEEIVDILRDGDHDLLDEALAEGMLVCGDLALERGTATLTADHAVSPATALGAGLAYAASIPLRGRGCALTRLNTLSHVRCTMVGALVDENGLEAVLRHPRYAGVGWQPAAELAVLSPTYVLSRHTAERQVGIELALFVEDSELIALLRPAQLLLD